MVICLEQGADLHTAQLMPLPLTVSCFSKIQIGFTFLVPAHPGSPGQRAVKRVCVYTGKSSGKQDHYVNSGTMMSIGWIYHHMLIYTHYKLHLHLVTVWLVM